jgi:hypothetical protein
MSLNVNLVPSDRGVESVREGSVGVIHGLVLQAVIEAAKELVEQVPQGGGVVFSGIALVVVVGSWCVGAERGEGPHVACGGQPLLIEHAKAEGPITYIPERLVEARLQRQRTVLRPGGPEYEVILDEVGLRRFSVPPEVMYAQLHHVIKVAEIQPRVTVRVFPLVTGTATSLMP